LVVPSAWRKAEDRLLLVGGNADAGVAHGEHDAHAHLVADAQADLAALGELDGVGQQVLEDLLQALAVGEQRAGSGCSSCTWKARPLSWASGSNMRRPSTRRSSWCFRAHFELAGLDLGDVEDVVDQVEQVVAGRVDRLGELDLG
jgi:hypothetical protein